VNAQAKARSDDTRGRIIETAEALFRRMGYAKTAVADIAAELGMSPANVYRFFPSKNAIVEAICQRCLSEVEEKAWAAARSKAPASQRMERLLLDILAYHKENLLTDQRVNDIVLVAIELSWDAIHAHKKTLNTVMELILRDGIGAGEFDNIDPRETSEVIMRSAVTFTHPIMIGQCMEDGLDLETEVRKFVRFQLRALAPR
jgi:AcrR family transcriptional regulator